MTPINGPRWTIAAATALAVTIGGTGFALANSGGGSAELPDPISLRDRAPVQATTESAQSLVKVTSAPIFRQNEDGTFSLVQSLSASVSDSLDSLTDDTVSNDTISDDTISGDTVSGDTTSLDTVSIDSDTLDSVDSTT